ncbi:MAG: carbohydrate ABC transporter permease [Anaerolineae bacterium]
MAQSRSMARSGSLGGLWPQFVRATHRPQFWFAVLGVVPTLLFYGIFAFGPIVRAFPMAFQFYDILDPSNSRFVGFDNWRRISELPLFWTSIRNTLYWAALSFIFALPISLFVSLCLAGVKRGRNFYQAIIFLPVVVSLVAISLLFRMLMDPEVGQLNQVLGFLGLPKLRWLSDSSTALASAVGIGVWKGLGFQVVLITAGLLGIPEELYDAAKVDGVNEWQRFWYLTLPLLANTVLLITVLMAIGSLQTFVLPYLLGGKADHTYVFNQLLYDEAFVSWRFGSAAAASLLQFAFILIITLAQIKLIRPAWSY